ncbi:MAG: hypothetical protein ACLFTE_07050, partial [Salinivenus sp.]
MNRLVAVLSILIFSSFFVLSPASAQFDRNWEFSSAQGDRPSYIGSDDDARALAYGEVDDGSGTLVERVLVAIGGSDPYEIKILDADDGSDTGDTLSGVSGLPSPNNGRKITDVEVTDDGLIIACNTPNNPFLGGSTENFKCWTWDSLTDDPTEVIDYTPPDNSGDGLGDWVGRQISVKGTADDNSLTILTGAASGDGETSPYVYRFTTSDNGDSFSAEEIERKDQPPSGSLVGVAQSDTGAAPFFFNEGTTQPRRYDADGNEEAEEPGLVSNFTWAPMYFEAAGDEWLTIFNWESDGGQYATLANITDGLDEPSVYGSTPSLGSEDNVNGTGDVDVRINDDETATFFVISTNNGIGSYTSSDPLPVELAGFDAVQSGSSVELTWQTASETNNAGFHVQRETEEGEWTDLGFVESKAENGTTTESLAYRYEVEEELPPGTHRFRLKQVDLDGTPHPSEAETVEVRMDEALSLSAPAPNPASDQTTVRFAVQEPSETEVAVYNV